MLVVTGGGKLKRECDAKASSIR